MKLSKVERTLCVQHYLCFIQSMSFRKLLMIAFLLKTEFFVQANFSSSSDKYNINNNDETGRNEQLSKKQQKFLMTTLFVEKCVGDNSTTYKTPVNECYNGNNRGTRTMTEEDTDVDGNSLPSITLWKSNPYGDHDIKDELVKVNDTAIGIFRSFYKSTNGTCLGGVTDSFPNIPLDSCVGPFGEPYPWGTLELIPPTNLNEDIVAVA